MVLVGNKYSATHCSCPHQALRLKQWLGME